MILKIDKYNNLDPFESAIETAPIDWSFAEKIQLVDNVSGGACKNKTSISLHANADYLFIRFLCFSNSIFSHLTERNSTVWEDEVAEVFLQPSGMENLYYELDVNPNNAVAELFIHNHDGPDGFKIIQTISPWNCNNLETRIYVQGKLNEINGAQYWVAEYKIPFKSLIAKPIIQDENIWNANFYRIDRSEKDVVYQAWNPTGKIDFHMMDKFRQIKF